MWKEKVSLVRDVLAAIDQGQYDVPQGRKREAESCSAVTGLAQNLHTAAQVDEMQSAPASRH